MADREDFENTAMPHLDAVFRAAVALCGREAEAEDLTQATFLKALERFDSFRAGTNCRAWLLRILRNAWIDRLRRQKVAGPELPIEESRLAAPPERPATTWTGAADLLENFSDEQVIRALAELPPEQRLTLFLVDVEQLSHEDVAAVMKVPPGTVKSRSSRARAQLKDRLAAHARDMGLVERER